MCRVRLFGYFLEEKLLHVEQEKGFMVINRLLKTHLLGIYGLRLQY